MIYLRRMKLVSYLKEENEQLAVLVDDRLYNIELIHPDIPNTMNMFLSYGMSSFLSFRPERWPFATGSFMPADQSI